MKIQLEQLFFGRGEHGYSVLGASSGCPPLEHRLESLCDSLGTPVGDYDGTPFLLSVPEGDWVLMVCVRRGAPDSMKRDTLFFHALVAAKKDLDAAKANAFTLFDQGAFAAKMPAGTVEVLWFDCKPGRDGSTSRPPDGRAVDASLPCFVRSPSPAPDVVRALVGDRANELAWATFAFRPLDGFDVQVLPLRGAAPRSANECDAEGNLVRVSESSDSRTTPVSLAGSSGQGPQERRNPPLPNNPTMLKISLFANLVLLALCAALFASRKFSPDPLAKPEAAVVTKVVEAPLSDERKKEIERKAVEAAQQGIKENAVKKYRAELASQFPQEQRIEGSFFTSITNLPPCKSLSHAAEGEFELAESYLKKADGYVDFLNKIFPEKENENAKESSN